jgi:hypothetical protein
MVSYTTSYAVFPAEGGRKGRERGGQGRRQERSTTMDKYCQSLALLPYISLLREAIYTVRSTPLSTPHPCMNFGSQPPLLYQYTKIIVLLCQLCSHPLLDIYSIFKKISGTGGDHLGRVNWRGAGLFLLLLLPKTQNQTWGGGKSLCTAT